MCVKRALAAAMLAAHTALAFAAATAPDEPQVRVAPAALIEEAPTYAAALQSWTNADDVNAWIGAKFEYDRSRAMLLSETQRQNSRVAIHSPEVFYTAPSGVCVDLARFAVETLRAIDPSAKPMYVMIEFEPVTIQGNVLRRHWVVSFERDGRRYFFADSNRPGHVAGPYASTDDFIAEYASYRGRRIVAFREVESYLRRERTLATQQPAVNR